jgi:hypothetical protein
MNAAAQARSKVPPLPRGWRCNEIPGGAELRAAPPRRPYIIAVLALLTALTAWKSIALWSWLPLPHRVGWAGLSLALALFTGWCVLDGEAWILESDRVTHRIGIGSWSYKRQVEHAELEIVLDISAHFRVPCYRLHAVTQGQPHFLFERQQPDLQLLAAFISFYTGWPIRPARVMPFRSLVPGGNE